MCHAVNYQYSCELSRNGQDFMTLMHTAVISPLSFKATVSVIQLILEGGNIWNISCSFLKSFPFVPSWLKLCLKRTKFRNQLRKCGNCYRKACREEGADVEPCDICNLRDWLKNYHLNTVNAFSLFNEFLEMGGCVWTALIHSSLLVWFPPPVTHIHILWKYKLGPSAHFTLLS